MTFEFTPTIDDMRESTGLLGVPRPTSRWLNAVGYLALTIAAACAALPESVRQVWLPWATSNGSAAAAAADAPPRNLWVTLAPSLFAVTWMLASTAARAWLAAHPTNGPAARRRAQALYTASILFGLTWFAVANVPALVINWRPTDAQALWAAAVPWVACTGVLAVTSIGAARRATDRAWAADPSMAHPVAVDVSDAGIVVTLPTVSHHYQWRYFANYRETATLLLLTGTDRRTLFAPKRALSSHDLDRLRGLLQTHIATGTFLPRDVAFPVVSVS